MTQEENDLLIKDLSARLSYGVKVKLPNDNEHYTLLSVLWNKGVAIIGMEIDGMYATSKVKIEDCKPYLRSLEDMTKEERIELYSRLFNLEGLSFADIINYSGDTISPLYDWLNEHHFDYRGLIKKGLAIDCADLNIY